MTEPVRSLEHRGGGGGGGGQQLVVEGGTGKAVTVG